jgi:hypothetical protein
MGCDWLMPSAAVPLAGAIPAAQNGINFYPENGLPNAPFLKE